MQPNITFFGIGAPKSATSWIDKCLKEHPNIVTPEPKEIGLFINDEKPTQDNYYKFFSNYDDNKICGEYCNLYLYDKNTLLRIKNHYPDTKIIICLRNPIDRMLSHYLFRNSTGSEEFTDINKKIIDDLNIFSDKPKKTIQCSLYYTPIKNCFEIFDKDKVLIIFYNDIKNKPKGTIKKLYSFLEVTPDFTPTSTGKKINITTKDAKKISWLPALLNTLTKIINNKKLAFIKKSLKKINLFKIKKKILSWNTKRQNLKPVAKPELSEEVKNKLHKFYINDIKNLEKLLNINLDRWK